MIAPKYCKDGENTSLIFFYAEIFKSARIGIRARWRSKSWEVVSGADPLTCCLYDFEGSFLTLMSLFPQHPPPPPKKRKNRVMWTLANTLTDYVNQMRQYTWKHFKVKYCIQVAYHPTIHTQTVVALLWSRRKESTGNNSLGWRWYGGNWFGVLWHKKYM